MKRKLRRTLRRAWRVYLKKEVYDEPSTAVSGLYPVRVLRQDIPRERSGRLELQGQRDGD